MRAGQELIHKASKRFKNDSELATRLGVSPSLLSLMRNGDRNVTPALAAELAEIAGLDARQAVVDAVIEASPKQKMLKRILGKAMAAKTVSTAALVAYTSPMSEAIGKIANGFYRVTRVHIRPERRVSDVPVAVDRRKPRTDQEQPTTQERRRLKQSGLF